MSLARCGALAGLAFTGGCAVTTTAPAPVEVATLVAACPPGMAERSSITAFFGRNGTRNGREFLRVAAADWDGFQRANLTPRFPGGSTTFDAVGTWQGQALAEPTKVFLAVVPAGATGAALQALRAAIETYRRDFGQQSVGIIVTTACAAGF